MKLTKALLLVLGATVILAKNANHIQKAHPLANKTEGNMTHPIHPAHPAHLRGHGHHGKHAVKPAEPEENNESEVNEEASAVAEQGEDAEEELARILADKKVVKNKKGPQRRGHKKNGKKGKKHHVVKHEDFGENAEGVIGGEDAEDIESELKRLLPQAHQGKGNNNNNKNKGHGKKGGRPHWKKPQVKPELKPEDFEGFGEHHFFGEDAFENGEGFGFGWNHHKKH